MKHTDLYAKYQALDAQERRELIAAVKAHGGEYSFPKCDEDGDDNRPVVCASFKHADDPGDYTVTRVAVDDEYGALSIYGCPKDDETFEDLLYYIEFHHISYITAAIPETDTVKDVSETVK